MKRSIVSTHSAKSHYVKRVFNCYLSEIHTNNNTENYYDYQTAIDATDSSFPITKETEIYILLTVHVYQYILFKSFINIIRCI